MQLKGLTKFLVTSPSDPAVQMTRPQM